MHSESITLKTSREVEIGKGGTRGRDRNDLTTRTGRLGRKLTSVCVCEKVRRKTENNDGQYESEKGQGMGKINPIGVRNSESSPS